MDLAKELGAAEEFSTQKLCLYIPDKDKVGGEVRDYERFEANIKNLRSFLHRFGQETSQGEVVVEFDGRFYRIRTYDEPTE
jgi:hypothetical protein